MLEKIHSDRGTPPGGHYSQAIKVGNLLFTAGQIAYNPETDQIVNDTIENETRQVLNNLSAIAKAANTSLANTVKTTVFT